MMICQNNKHIFIILIVLIFLSFFTIAYSQFEELKFQHFDVDAGLSQNTVIFIEQDKYGFMWFGTFNGLCRFDGYEFKIYKNVRNNPRSLSMSRCLDSKLDSAGNLWIVTYDSLVNLYNYETDDFTRYTFKEINFKVDTLKQQAGRNFIYKNHKFYYKFGPIDSIEYTNLNTGKTIRVNGDRKDQYSLHDIFINDIFVDKYKIFWVGTFSNGFSKADLNRKKIKHYKKDESSDNTFISHDIREIYEDSKGILWIGTRNSGVIKFDRKNNTYKTYGLERNNPNSIVFDQIREIYQDSKGIFWFGTKQGLDRFDPKTETFYNVFKDTSRQFWVFDIIEDHRGSIWIASFGGLYKYNNETNGVIVYNAEKGFLYDNNSRFVMEDSKKQIWVGSETGGVTRLVRKSRPVVLMEEFEPHFYFPDSSISKSNFESKRAYCICEDENNTIWIGTAEGLKKYINETDSFVHFGTENGLPDEMIIGIVPDLKGHLWLSHKRGISRFNIKSNEVKNFDILDGLQGMEFNEDAYFRNKNTGEIFFGGPNGFNTFFPDSILDNPFVPEVYITSLEIDEEPVEIGQLINGRLILKKNIIITKEITLTHREKKFSIEFTGLHYANPVNNKYKYKLEGFDIKWINTDANNRHAVYSNLSPKTYIFKVKAANADGIWNEKEASIKIIVTPPFWETWWFRSIIGLIVAIIILTVYYMRVSSLRKQKIILENKVEQRTNELKISYDNLRNISEFGQEITSNLDLSHINNMIYNYLKSFLDTFDFGIGIFNLDKEVIEYKMFFEDGKMISPYERALTNKNSFSIYCYENQKTIFINNLEKEYIKYFSEIPDFSISRIPNSLINIPLTVKEKKIGLLAINSIKKDAFSENDLLKLQTLAAYIAIALDNAESQATLQKNNILLLKRQKKIEEQSEHINETNTILEERQQHIEEQSEELRAQADKLFVANENLKSSNATKDKLFSIIAHDLKNPFSSVLGFSELIVRSWDKIEDNKMKHMVETIYSSSKNIYNLLENLLQWSRSQMGNIKFNPENILLYDLAKENIDLLSNLVTQKNITIELNIPKDLYCYADSQMIKTVIRNILTNAIKYTENGTITLSTEIKENIVKISIEDTGVGIAEDKLINLFEVEKSKSTYGTRGEQGTGLGLIISKEFVESNGGLIYAKSNVNKGSTFIFTLPLGG